MDQALLSRLLAVEPLPRGERLARWLLGNSRIPDIPGPLRRYARPLRLARERLREMRDDLRRTDASLQWHATRHMAEAIRAGAEEDRAQRAEAKLARLREKVWRRDMKNSMCREMGWHAHYLSAAAGIRRNKYGADAAKRSIRNACAARIAMHAAGRGVPGSQPGWEG